MNYLKNSLPSSTAPLEGKVQTFVCLDETRPVTILSDLVEKLKHQIELQFELHTSLEQISTVLPSAMPALIVSSIQTQADTEKTLNFLTAQKTKFTKELLKVILIDSLEEPLVSSILQIRGNVEILTANVSIKELNFKVRNHLRILNLKTSSPAIPEFTFDRLDKTINSNERELKKDLDQVDHSFQNLSLKIRARGRYHSENAREPSIRLVELDGQTCILEVPEELVGNRDFFLEMCTSETPEDAKAFFQLEVDTLLGTSNGRSVVSVRLNDDALKNLRTIVRTFESRRTGMMRFLREARGIE